MAPEFKRAGESISGGEAELDGEGRPYPRPTRRGVLLGVSLAGLGGALAGCSTAAVPYDANEAGVVEEKGAAQAVMPSSGAMGTAGAMSTTGAMPSPGPARAKPKKTDAKLTGMVLGAASEIPVGGGKIYTAARVVVTQPTRGQYAAFSAVCTHVGCIMSEVANGTIDCPCHGSEFKITTGAVVTGPAPAPLPKKQIKIVDGQILLL